MTRGFAAVLGILTLGLSDCNEPESCTLVACTGSLLIDIHGVALDAGNYELTVEGGQSPLGCSFVLNEAEPAGETYICQSSDSEWKIADDGTLRFNLAIPWGDHPATVVVRLVYTDVVVAEASLQPDWSDPFYPNGEECDADGCRSASLDIVAASER